MIDYRAGQWGFHVSLGWRGSLAPRALTMAVPNAIITFIIATYFVHYKKEAADVEGDFVQKVIAAFEVVMIFILYNRSRTSYNRWWEGGTLLQKTRGEWFNAYSSIMAFTSTRPEMQDQVEAYTHCLARLMSLLMCCGLQQVSPNRDRPFAILDLEGVEPESMEFLNGAPDKVEVILQWVQRSMVLHMQTGVLPVAPPILSRAFQEVSRGIVNLQNARKIADFPYPYPLAQVSMILQLFHWAMIPIAAPLAMTRVWAVMYSFFSIFVLWCIHFNALDLEFPFGDRVNDLPMHDMQQDWNNSICALLDKRASQPPTFNYDPTVHNDIKIAMSDASTLYVPAKATMNKGNAVIKVPSRKRITPVMTHTSSIPSIGSIDTADVQITSNADAPNTASNSKDTSKTPHNANPKDSHKTEKGLSTSSTLSSTTSAESPGLMQSSPIDSRSLAPPQIDSPSAILPDLVGRIDPLEFTSNSLEMPADELPKMASPIFLRQPEVCEESPSTASRGPVTQVCSAPHSTTATSRALGDRNPAEESMISGDAASDAAIQVTIRLENLNV